MVDIKVTYSDKSCDIFKFNLPKNIKAKHQKHRSTNAILCELKRRIKSSKNIGYLEQKLSFNDTTLSFNSLLNTTLYPSINCLSRKRNPNWKIKIYSRNKDEISVDVDPVRDTIIDLKFILADKIGTKPEYINFVVNYSNRIYNNTMLIAGSGALDDVNIVHYWLEIPQNDGGFIVKSQPKLIETPKDMGTIGQAWRYYANLYKNKSCTGVRSFNSNGTRGGYIWSTYNDVNNRVSNFASGMVSNLKLGTGTRIGICSANRAEWLIADYAGHTQSMITVPLYDTLSKNAIEYIINHAEVSVVVCDVNTINEILKVRKLCKTLKYVVLCDSMESDKQYISKNKPKYDYLFSEIESFGSQNRVKDNFPSMNDIATICYTSGTTGNPKGVILTECGMMNAVEGARISMREQMTDHEVHISYLPLAHVYEKMISLFMLILGGSIAYWQGDVLKLLDDITYAKPTVFVGVPRVYQKFQDKITAQVNSSSFIKRSLFNKAFASKEYSIKNKTQPSGIWDKLVFSKIREKFGGNITKCVSGSAPLSATTAAFLKVCFAKDVSEGYGLTETAASGCVSDPNDTELSHVGSPTANIELKLNSVEDMNYLITDEPCPRGEIWLKGPAIFKGYYKNPTKSNEVLTNDGWFKTGDIGLWRPDGKLQIIDRKKNIFKLAQGEYIRPDYIENVYKQCMYIANIFVYGDSNETYLVGIVVPDFEVLTEWANNNGLSNIANDKNKLINNSKVINLIRTDMDNVGKKEELNGFEKIKRFKLIIDDFTVESGILTSTMKLKRNVAKNMFINDINMLYKQASKSKL